MPGAARLDRGSPRKKNVKEQCQFPVLSHPPEVRDRPKVAPLHRELKDEWVFGDFNRSPRRVRWRRQDLHARALSSPGTGHAKGAKAAVAPNLMRSGFLDLLDNLLPRNGIERQTRLDGDDLLAVGESQLYPARSARERKIELVRIAVAAIILAWFSDALEQNEPQFGGVKVGPAGL